MAFGRLHFYSLWPLEDFTFIRYGLWKTSLLFVMAFGRLHFYSLWPLEDFTFINFGVFHLPTELHLAPQGEKTNTSELVGALILMLYISTPSLHLCETKLFCGCYYLFSIHSTINILGGELCSLLL